MSPRDILTLPAPAADVRLPYGTDAKQSGELRIPKGGGKFPVAILLHGGFWRNQLNLAYMGHVAESLRHAGVATWNLEYRSLGDHGGGWPGTCDDVVSGARYLRVISEAHHLDLSRAVAVGHSAGGHLALWLASRKSLPLAGVVGLGAVADLGRALALQLSNSVVAQFLGGAPLAPADPMRLLPLHTPIRLFHGKQDDIVPIEIAAGFIEAAKHAGDAATLITLDGGHFEPVNPATRQWAAVLTEILRLVRLPAAA